MTVQGRIAVFSLDAKLAPEVKGATRYTFLANMLVQHGYSVDFVTSTFQHWDKEQRDTVSFDDSDRAFDVKFIAEPGYPKNMCPQRIWSHHVAARNAAAYFEAHHDYALIYCQIPPNDITHAIGEVAKRYGVPFVIDVNDLWPEAFRVALDVPVVSDLLFAPFEKQRAMLTTWLVLSWALLMSTPGEALKTVFTIFLSLRFMLAMTLMNLIPALPNMRIKSKNPVMRFGLFTQVR